MPAQQAGVFGGAAGGFAVLRSLQAAEFIALSGRAAGCREAG